MWTSSLCDDLAKYDIMEQFSSSFGILVNLLADRYTPTDKDAYPVERLPESLNPKSVLDFILYGVLTYSAQSEMKFDARAAGLPTLEPAYAEKLLQHLFLECITRQWRSECDGRSRLSIWSPMPWSVLSKRELPTGQTFPERMNSQAPILNDKFLDEDGPETNRLRRVLGSPSDIPWLGARHDSHPARVPLPAYVSLRRNALKAGTQSLHADAALWLGAMTFGVLEAVLNIHIPESMLLTPGLRPDESVISGTRVLRLMGTWMLHMKQAHSHEHAGGGETKHLQHGRKAVQVLERALRALEEERDFNCASVFRRAGFKREEMQNIVGSILLTILPLCRVVGMQIGWASLSGLAFLNRVLDGSSLGLCSAARTFCKDRILGAGWCPYLISGIEKSSTGCKLLSNFSRLSPHLETTADEHERCTEVACIPHIVTDVSTYPPRHTRPSCTCNCIHPLLEDVERLLSSDVVPVVVYDGKALSIRSSTDTPYVAFSHIWADGMGSTAETGLRACTASRLAGLAKALLPGTVGAFWIDSLCVPGSLALCNKAIQLMNPTLRGAAKVLAIDNSIRAQCSLKKPWEENLLRIAAAAWQQRIWTLPEGLLARELYFEFAEGPVNVQAELSANAPQFVESTGLTNVSADSTDGQLLPVRREWGEYLSAIPVLDSRIGQDDAAECEVDSVDLSLTRIIELLQSRPSMLPEDELLAVATLLTGQTDIGALLSIRSDSEESVVQQRMRAFLLKMRTVPQSFPMYAIPRLSLPGFTWAPRALATVIPECYTSVGDATCTEHGLLARYHLAWLDRRVSITLLDKCENVDTHGIPPDHWQALATLRTQTSPFNFVLWGQSGQLFGDCIDALLFLDSEAFRVCSEDESGRYVNCAAVCTTPELEYLTNAGSVDSDPRHFCYVAPCILYRTSSRAREEEVSEPLLGEVANSWVLLR
ncbi:hypothetical protein C8Q78DRAFT_110657 [Trametes maxima]|nr:hypothetical protein C8Q78DRAFT_110657 [Trametes maxima]